ncbi:MAG TPA: crosslink repair DNA glycosylase YcaQ family protein [Chloroflexota bacterium]
MSLSLSLDEARGLLIRYHLEPTDVAGVFQRLGTVQYDPLNMVGRNPDLVFQARVPGYRIDGWLDPVYRDRVAYDAWDKQACLVPTSEWPLRRLTRAKYRPWHDHEILAAHPEAVAAALDEIDRRGPLSSLEFEDRSRVSSGHSWYGPTRIKRILRALWAEGLLVTHHRLGARHYYDRPERVIPSEHFTLTGPEDEGAYHRWILLRRYTAAGLLRPSGDASIWSACGDAPTRARALAELVEEGSLIPMHVGLPAILYHMPAAALSALSAPDPEPRVVFLRPLDSLLWDRKAVKHLFGFDYVWEVYKPTAQRRWGYYVLPFLYGNRFIGRVDSRMEGGSWKIDRWWWEDGEVKDAALLDALSKGASAFAEYLGATSIEVSDAVDHTARQALTGGSLRAIW